MATHHDDVAVVAGGRLGEDVEGGLDLAHRVGEDPHLEAWRAGQCLSQRIGGAEHRNATCVVGREGDRRDALASGIRRLALVEDHDADGTGGGGVLGLELERARASLEQGDVSGSEAGEVSGLAAAVRRVAEAELQVDGADRCRHVTGVGLVDHAEIDVLDVRDLPRRGLLQHRRTDLREREVVERLDDRVVAGGLEALDHVLDRGVMTRQAGEAVAAVGVGDGLESRLVLAHAVEGDALQQLLDGVVVATPAGRGAGFGRPPVQRDHHGRHRKRGRTSPELGHLYPLVSGRLPTERREDISPSADRAERGRRRPRSKAWSQL